MSRKVQLIAFAIFSAGALGLASCGPSELDKLAKDTCDALREATSVEMRNVALLIAAQRAQEIGVTNEELSSRMDGCESNGSSD